MTPDCTSVMPCHRCSLSERPITLQTNTNAAKLNTNAMKLNHEVNAQSKSQCYAAKTMKPTNAIKQIANAMKLSRANVANK